MTDHLRDEWSLNGYDELLRNGQKVTPMGSGRPIMLRAPDAASFRACVLDRLKAAEADVERLKEYAAWYARQIDQPWAYDALEGVHLGFCHQGGGPALECNNCGTKPRAYGLLKPDSKAGDQCPCCFIPEMDCDGTLVAATEDEIDIPDGGGDGG